jgi:hypothetical protein
MSGAMGTYLLLPLLFILRLQYGEQHLCVQSDLKVRIHILKSDATIFLNDEDRRHGENVVA